MVLVANECLEDFYCFRFSFSSCLRLSYGRLSTARDNKSSETETFFSRFVLLQHRKFIMTNGSIFENGSSAISFVADVNDES